MIPRSNVDYATDQITVYRFCPYRCRYCYVWNNKLFISRIQRGKYNPVEEAKKYLGKKDRTIVVSFVSDPYPPQEKGRKLTRRVLEILCSSRNRVMVLTKNPKLALRDIDILKRGDCWLGTTVITLDHRWVRALEPYAPHPIERINALTTAHDEGVKTWISIEPIIPRVAEYDLDAIINIAINIPVDFIVLGAYNYWNKLFLPEIQYPFIHEYGFEIKHVDPNPCCVKELKEFYIKHIPKIIEKLEKHGIKYYVKKELKKYLEK